MAGSSIQLPEGGKKARIEIIPLIDVIFFLLATFVLITITLNKIQSLPLNLPVASNQPKSQLDKDDTVYLQVSDQGTCYWNKQLINVSEIKGRLQQLKHDVANPRVLISTDDRAKYGVAIHVLDEVRQAGITEVSVQTRVLPTGS